MTPTVRPARESDLPGILEIYNHYVTTSPTTFEVERVSLEDRRS